MARDLNIDCKVRFRNGPEIAPQAVFSGAPGRTTALFGPSGSGKTTILRLAAGLTLPVSGNIRCGETIWSDDRTFCPVQKRRIGFVFQDYALFPHISVLGNILYHLDNKDTALRDAAFALIDKLGLQGLEHRRPAALSGGQRQRVALARAVIRRPHWLFLDEPMAALDQTTRLTVRTELREFLQREKIPTLIVTHEFNELAELADDIALIADGRVIQHGPTREVLRQPSSLTAARLLQFENIFSSEDKSPLPVAKKSTGIAFRAEFVHIEKPETPTLAGRIFIPVRITRIRSEGPLVRLTGEAGNTLIEAAITSQNHAAWMQPGHRACLSIDQRDVASIPLRG